MKDNTRNLAKIRKELTLEEKDAKNVDMEVRFYELLHAGYNQLAIVEKLRKEGF